MKRLSDYTPARVGLGLAGDSLPVKQLLEFRLAHARARDAVQFTLDTASLAQELAQNGWDSRVLRTQASTRGEYLKSPDKGRLLDAASEAELQAIERPGKLAFALVDGLSALAIQRHATPLLEAIAGGLQLAGQLPIFIVRGGRVAIGDPLGELLQAEISVVIIGERPGLSTPDSLGIYLTWNPRRGRNDSERNCISNIHSQGLSYQLAAHKLLFLIGESRRRKLSGVALKDTAEKVLQQSTSGE